MMRLEQLNTQTKEKIWEDTNLDGSMAQLWLTVPMVMDFRGIFPL